MDGDNEERTESMYETNPNDPTPPPQKKRKKKRKKRLRGGQGGGGGGDKSPRRLCQNRQCYRTRSFFLEVPYLMKAVNQNSQLQDKCYLDAFAVSEKDGEAEGRVRWSVFTNKVMRPRNTSPWLRYNTQRAQGLAATSRSLDKPIMIARGLLGLRRMHEQWQRRSQGLQKRNSTYGQHLNCYQTSCHHVLPYRSNDRIIIPTALHSLQTIIIPLWKERGEDSKPAGSDRVQD